MKKKETTPKNYPREEIRTNTISKRLCPLHIKSDSGMTRVFSATILTFNNLNTSTK
jgi:hypothetical protein